MTAPAKLTNLQLELLQTFAYSLDDAQLLEIRQILAHYFLNKADAEMDKLWQANGWNETTIDTWAKGHDRASSVPISRGLLGKNPLLPRHWHR